MKICDVTQLYNPIAGGGIQTYLEEKKQHIIGSTNHSYVFIYPGSHYAKESNGTLVQYQIPGRRLGTKNSYRLSFRLDLLRQILSNEKPDVIEFHTPYLCQYPVMNQKKKHPTLIIGFFHTDISGAYVYPTVKKWLGERITRFLVSLTDQYITSLYQKCDLTLVPSVLHQNKLKAMHCSNTLFFPLGVDGKVFHPMKRSHALREKLGIQPKDCMLIYSGRLDEEKKVDFLIHSLAFLPENFSYKLLLIGEGSNKKKLMDLAKGNHHILFIPFMKDKDILAQYLASSDVYLSPGPHETFGLSILEAQACGLPVVGVKAGALLERVTEGLGRLSPVGEKEAFASNIIEVFKECNPVIKATIQNQVLSKYSWDSRLNQLMSIYENHNQCSIRNNKTTP